MLRDFLLPRFREVERLVAIDVHTGLGNYGVDTLLVDSSLSQRSIAGFAARVQKPQMKGVAYHVEGPLYNLYQWTAPKAERIFAFQEFGTYSALRVLQALRLENYWHQQNVGISHAAKEKLLSIFAPKDRAWRDQVIARGSAAIDHGLTLLH
jgi:hypothetical protein